MKSVKYEYGVGFKIISILCGALIGGMLWRVRGDSGFGAKWGMFVVAAGLSLFAFFIFGERQKIQFKLFPLLVILTGITAGGWGTLCMQMSGKFGASAVFVGEEAIRMVDVNPLSGLFIMLCLGFGWMPFFAFLFGYYFSGRKYKFSEIAIGVAGFYLVYFLFKASVSHSIAELFCSDAVRLFKDGLADQSLDITPWRYVMEHFASDGPAKAIPGGRNYYATVEAISAALATVCLCLYQRLKLKDKAASYITFAISTVMAFAITLADLPMTSNAENSILKSSFLYNLLDGKNLWSLWEYGTGFLLGLGFMLVCHIAHKKGEKKSLYIQEAFPSLRGKGAVVYYALVSLFAPLCFTLIRPLSTRIDSEEGVLSLIIMGVLGLVFFGVWLVIVYRNMVKKGLDTPLKKPFAAFCADAFIVYFIAVSLIYFLVGSDAPFIAGNYDYITMMMLVSFAAVIGFYFIIRARLKSLK